MSNPEQVEEFWKLAENEFYDSPYFRMHHAYYLGQQGQTKRCWAKLVALVQEMPWLREASLNLSILFKKLDPTGTEIMPEFQEQLRQTINANHWSTEGMTKINLNI